MRLKVAQVKLWHRDMNQSGNMRTVEVHIDVDGGAGKTNAEIIAKIEEAVAKASSI